MMDANDTEAWEENANAFEQLLSRDGITTNSKDAEPLPDLRSFIRERLKAQEAAAKQNRDGRSRDGLFRLDADTEDWQAHNDRDNEELCAELLYQAWRQRPLQGSTLNMVDTQQIAGIEQYLPTPITRMRVIRDRLQAEIKELETAIHQLRSALGEKPSASSTERLARLDERLGQLKQRQQRVQHDIEQLYAKESFLVRLGSRWGQWFSKAQQVETASGKQEKNAAGLPWNAFLQQVQATMGLPSAQLTELRQLSRDLSVVDDLLKSKQELLAQGSPRSQLEQLNADEYSDLFRHLDATLNRLDKLQHKSLEISQRGNWLNQQWQGLYQRWFRAVPVDTTATKPATNPFEALNRKA